MLTEERIKEIQRRPESMTDGEFDVLQDMITAAHDAEERLQRVYHILCGRRYEGYLGRIK